MNKKELFNKLLFYTGVPKCVCCREMLDISDVALCSSCLKEYEPVKKHICSVCFKNINECVCVNDYLNSHSVKKLIKLFRYKPSSDPNERLPHNELIYNIKRGKRKDLLDFISDELVCAVKNNIKYDDYIITNVPRKKSRVLKYGLDHSAEIAKAVARKLGIEYRMLLVSKAKSAQKKTKGEQRLKNPKFDYKRKAGNISGKRIILVDDIVTTGASMGSCAMLIKGLGAKEIVGLTMGITYKDKYTEFKRTYY